MSLKAKIILIFGLLFIAFGLMQVAINKIFIMPSFINLENDEAIRNLNRINEAIDKEIRHLDDVCHDWGSWDDSCDFMETGSKDYEEGNLSIESFITANLNLIYYLDKNGELFWGRIYDLEAEKEISLNGFTRDDFSKISENFKWDSGLSEAPESIYKRGIILTEKDPILLAARPILSSENAGSSHGTLIMGRFLSEAVLRKLKDETKVDFSIHINDSDMPEKLKTILNKNSTSPFIKRENSNKILMYMPYNSIAGNPVFLIKVAFPREITMQGIKTINYSLIFMAVSGFILLSIILTLIKNVIIKPIIDLSKKMEEVEEGNYNLEINMNRKDAIGKLAGSFEKMLAKIESQTTQLKKLSSTDGLTGVYNRRIFDETLAVEWNRMTRQDQTHLSAIMCDVDFFKLYNDTYGHQTGDDCLKRVADTIKSVLRRPADFFARYGGEEFIALLPNTDSENAVKVAEHMRKKVSDLKIEHLKSGIGKYVTVSLGVSSVIPSKDVTPTDLIKTADKALYECKEKGRNQVVYKSVSEN